MNDEEIERLRRIEAAARRVVSAYWLAEHFEEYGYDDDTLDLVDEMISIVDPDGKIKQEIEIYINGVVRHL